MCHTQILCFTPPPKIDYLKSSKQQQSFAFESINKNSPKTKKTVQKNA